MSERNMNSRDGSSHPSIGAIAAPPGTTPLLGKLWWSPLAFVVAALMLLLATPFVVASRVTPIRNASVVTQRAQVLINDLEAVIAQQLLADGTSSLGELSAAADTRDQLVKDEDDLRAAVGMVDAEAVTHFDSLAALLRAWGVTPTDSLRTPGSELRARQIIAIAEVLDDHLSNVVAAQREKVMDLERVNRITAGILAPVALVAVGMVTWVGGRIAEFARVAEHERAEVIRSSEARAALLRGVTHDVKNPLGAAAGYAQLLDDGIVGPLSDPQREMVRRIHRLVGTSVATVTDLLELARVDGGDLSLEYERTDLGTIASEAVDDHSGSAVERGVTLKAAGTSPDPAPIVTDPQRVRQIVSNLLSNAIKYTPPGGQVTVSVVREPEAKRQRVGIQVADTGPGIPPELRSRVFGEFFRVRGAGSDTRGNGLGLAISRRLARMLGGDVTFRDGTPHGAVFTLWLEPQPPVPTPTAAPRPAERALPPAPVADTQ